MLGRGVARHAVIDDEVAVTQRLGKPIGPGLALPRADVVGRRAAEGGNDGPSVETALRILAARALARVLDHQPRRAGELERGDRHGLQQRMPFEALRLEFARRHQRGGAGPHPLQGEQAGPPGELEGHQHQDHASEPRPADQRQHQGEQDQQIEEVLAARPAERQLVGRTHPRGSQQREQRQQDRQPGQDGPLESIRTAEAEMVEKECGGGAGHF